MSEQKSRTMLTALAKPFAPEDLEWRLQYTNEEKMCGMAVPYVTNRAIQNRLDEVCSPENWYNEFRPWHSAGKKDSQLCGIAIYFEGKGFITKWDGAEDSDIEPIKGGLSDSMKRAAYQWGIGRVLYSLDTVWVDIERRGRSYVIKGSERKKLDDAYLSALEKLGLEPAKACGIQSLLTPKTAPEQKAADDQKPTSEPVQDQRRGGAAQQSAKPQERSAQQKPQTSPEKQENTAESTGKTVPFRNAAQAAPEENIYTVLAAKVQDGMSGSNTLVNLETPEKKQTYAYVRGVRPELTPGTQLSHVKLTTRKQDTVLFCVLESYEVYQQGQQAA
ncbi:Rad52/Rad22 family DNA repair protein [Hominicoprocola fusiformis]